MRFRLHLKSSFFSLLALSFITSYAHIEFTEELFFNVQQRYGNQAQQRVKDWQSLIDKNKDERVEDQLFEVNRFFNRVDFKNDIYHWDKNDYWATPVEFLGTNAGDCEDFAIAKYFTLLAMGIPQEKLKLMYVTATRPTRQAHMVLVYYESVNSVPLVLDNLNKRILPATKRRDLIPVYSFNGEGLWLAKTQGVGQKVNDGSNISLWANLNQRMLLGE